MRTVVVILVLFLSSFYSPAQRVHVGITGGLANYNGDILDKLYVAKQTNGFIGATVHYEILDQVLLRAAFSYARVNGSDRYNSKDYLRLRNEKRISPYVFAGLALFHFNPYTYDTTNKKFFLQPLSTEGQGIYPGKKSYSLLQPAIPFGGGIKFSVNENLRIGIEIGVRKLFTDYLDDVSTSYADYNDLLNAKGPAAVELAYREDELPGGNPVYPSKDTQRGSAKQKDVYYLTGLTLSFRLGNGGVGGSYNGTGKKGKYGCPSVPL
jgi:hypothetical protein